MDKLLQIPLSSVREVSIPAMPRGDAGYLLSLQYQLDQSQWWSPEELLTQQLGQLQILVEHAWRTIPFYRKRLESADYSPARKLTLEIFATLPILSRREVQKAERALGSKALHRDHGKTNLIQTSGSTARPIKVLTTKLAQLMINALTLRGVDWHPVVLRGKLAVIRVIGGKRPARPPNGLHQPVWGWATDRVYPGGTSALLEVHTPVGQQMEWLIKEEPDYLLTYPSNLKSLLQRFRRQGTDLPSLRGVRTIGETLDPELRGECEEVLGVPLVDGYSAQEVGLIALQCPEHPHYHVQSESMLVEVLDHAGQPCRPGQIGRVVVTGLHNFATPLIRYELGDYAEVGEACPCGRGLPVLKRILGRTRNMLRLPCGDEVWPKLRIHHYSDVVGEEIEQAQIVQETRERLQLRLVTKARLGKGQEEKLIRLLQEAVGYPFTISIRYPDALKRSKSGKFEDFMSLVDEN